MATNNRGGRRGGNRARRGPNNNPEGRNQHSGMTGLARDNPVTTAVAVGGAVAAGLFLWSRRNQISDQIAQLSEQIDEWRVGPGSETDFAGTSAERSQVEIAEEALTLKEIGNPA